MLTNALWAFLSACIYIHDTAFWFSYLPQYTCLFLPYILRHATFCGYTGEAFSAPALDHSPAPDTLWRLDTCSPGAGAQAGLLAGPHVLLVLFSGHCSYCYHLFHGRAAVVTAATGSLLNLTSVLLWTPWFPPPPPSPGFPPTTPHYHLAYVSVDPLPFTDADLPVARPSRTIAHCVWALPLPWHCRMRSQRLPLRHCLTTAASSRRMATPHPTPRMRRNRRWRCYFRAPPPPPAST